MSSSETESENSSNSSATSSGEEFLGGNDGIDGNDAHHLVNILFYIL
jgi:hypothetical protein